MTSIKPKMTCKKPKMTRIKPCKKAPQKLAADVLLALRANKLSYGEAKSSLYHAQQMLQHTIDEELNYLPIANGIEADFNPDHLILSSKGRCCDSSQSINDSGQNHND